MKKYWYLKILMMCSLAIGGLSIGSLIFFYNNMGYRETVVSITLFVAMMLTSSAMYLEMKKNQANKIQ